MVSEGYQLGGCKGHGCRKASLAAVWQGKTREQKRGRGRLSLRRRPTARVFRQGSQTGQSGASGILMAMTRWLLLLLGWFLCDLSSVLQPQLTQSHYSTLSSTASMFATIRSASASSSRSALLRLSRPLSSTPSVPLALLYPICNPQLTPFSTLCVLEVAWPLLAVTPTTRTCSSMRRLATSRASKAAVRLTRTLLLGGMKSSLRTFSFPFLSLHPFPLKPLALSRRALTDLDFCWLACAATPKPPSKQTRQSIRTSPSCRRRRSSTRTSTTRREELRRVERREPRALLLLGLRRLSYVPSLSLSLFLRPPPLLPALRAPYQQIPFHQLPSNFALLVGLLDLTQ